MGNEFASIFNNHLLITSALSWGAAQILKVILMLIINKKLDLSRLIGMGGMPSAHSAFVTSLTVAAGLEYGWSSPYFAISAALAIVVMYDAAGVRRAAGKQAARINEIITLLMSQEIGDAIKQEKLKELLGHTPLEVLAGALLGITIAIALSL